MASSVSAAFMSSVKRLGLLAEISASFAWIAASSGNDPVPPSFDSRSSAGADQPLAAHRPVTLAMRGVKPRFSWITSTPPRGLVARAHAPSGRAQPDWCPKRAR